MTEVYEDILDLTEVADPPDTMNLLGVIDPTGTPADRRAQLVNAVTRFLDSGWVRSRETWTYVTAATFIISGDKTAKYQMGMKLRLKQGGGYKYFFVVSAVYGAPNTTITVYALNGSDVIANAAITDGEFTSVVAPFGVGLVSPQIHAAFQPRGDGYDIFLPACTYVSATTFTIAGDWTAFFTPGLKLAVKQTTWKYFYVASSSYGAPNTTVTITGGSDYTLANAAMTDVLVARVEVSSFPEWINYVPAIVGYSANPTNAVYRFRYVGRTGFISIVEGANGTSNSTSLTIALPIAARTIANMTWSAHVSEAMDNAVSVLNALAIISSAGVVITFYKTAALGAWAGSSGKRASTRGTTIVYEI